MSFHLNAACGFANKHTKTHLKYHVVTAEPPFTVKMIECMHHIEPRNGEQHPAVCYPHV